MPCSTSAYENDQIKRPNHCIIVQYKKFLFRNESHWDCWGLFPYKRQPWYLSLNKDKMQTRICFGFSGNIGCCSEPSV